MQPLQDRRAVGAAAGNARTPRSTVFRPLQDRMYDTSGHACGGEHEQKTNTTARFPVPLCPRSQGAIICSLMASLTPTTQQKMAITTTGRSMIVSAAAGSGKTAVVAERCAYLLCDAPPSQRCSVEQLLVLTFTDAAAAEMRGRIIECVRVRVGQRPRDPRLREQLAMMDAAHISTIHSFCYWMIRRWFSELGINPAASLLDADEATLMKRDVLDALLGELYEAGAAGADASEPEPNPLAPCADAVDTHAGRAEASATPERERSDARLGRAFIQLVDDYGLGDDRDLGRVILDLHAYVGSLPDPWGWLRDARAALAGSGQSVMLARLDELRSELRQQVQHCERTVATLLCGDPVGHCFAEQIRDYARQLRAWVELIETQDASSSSARALETYERTRQLIASFEFSRARAPALAKDADAEIARARKAAMEQLGDIRKRLFGARLRQRFALFSVAESIEGLKRTAAYVATIEEVVRAFDDVYQKRKHRADVLDFADLERLAFDLLRSDEDPNRPSEVARTLQRRFQHVLVDEFQDINPIQEKIIRLVSREADATVDDNLFVVGDVKQSIYRFRLAEPGIFSRRLDAFRTGGDRGEAIALQHNFRSRPEILETVNLLFGQLMSTEDGDVAYDAQAELRGPPDAACDGIHRPVELHLLERTWNRIDDHDEPPEPGVAAADDPARWAPIEREAYLIGSKIRDWVEASGADAGDKVVYRDIAILLRAATVNADRMAAMLASMGIPAFAHAGGSLLSSLEVRDVLAVLQVLDNAQQDIPLAALLRNGVLGERLTDDDLVQVRSLDPDIPFHEAVRRFAVDGRDDGARRRLEVLMRRIDRLRGEVRRRPLANAIWIIYEEHGHLARAGGLPNGAQRRANLLKFHDLTRKFGSFRRQGLHRFLRFVESLHDESCDLGSAPAIGESDNVVRIMSIHQSKGLEFPVVFVAGLGTRFNLRDRAGRIIFERRTGIGLRIVDTNRMLEYPSVAHLRAAEEIERTTRQEELRILYVAMTRARDRLVLVGSLRNAEEIARSAGSRAPVALSRLSIATAATPMDWLIPALASVPDAATPNGVEGGPDRGCVETHFHGCEAMSSWQPVGFAQRSDDATLRAAARGDPLPAGEPFAPDDPQVEGVRSRIDYVYPSLASATVRAVVAASEFKGTHDFTRSSQDRPDSAERSETVETPDPSTTRTRDDAALRGVVTHRVLQHLDFSLAVDSAGVASEMQRIERLCALSKEDIALVDRAGIEWFVSTPLADAIRRGGASFRREFQFLTTESPALFDPSVGITDDDSVLVRGIVDGILPVEDGVEIIDFKTDAVEPSGAAERANRYAPQMRLYARAMRRLWRCPVVACWLVFLTAQELVRLDDITGSDDTNGGV